MKVGALTKLMNDYGTNPRVKVMKHTNEFSLLAYEGTPDNIDEETAKLKLNTFTVLGKGFIEIHAQ